MSRTDSPRSVWTTTKRRPDTACPIRMNLVSSSDESGSRIVLERGSPKVVAASSKETPCFSRFTADLPASHSKFMLPRCPTRHNYYSTTGRNGRSCRIIPDAVYHLGERAPVIHPLGLLRILSDSIYCDRRISGCRIRCGAGRRKPDSPPGLAPGAVGSERRLAAEARPRSGPLCHVHAAVARKHLARREAEQARVLDRAH